MSHDVYDAKTDVYATFGNGVVLRLAHDLLPAGGSVLDIGCASGGLLAHLGHAGRRVGIEPAADGARAAAAFADEVHHAGIDDELPLSDGEFDVVVLADVVEHLVDPPAAVARAVTWCRPGGHVIVSVPNIAHWQARLVVARGEWRAEESGTFDATHLRFFTLARVRALLADAGLADVCVEPVVPALRNHVGAVRRLPPGLGAQVERGWQALGRARPNAMGYQLVGRGRRR